MTKRLDVFVDSNGSHLHQLYSAFYQLKKSKKCQIRLIAKNKLSCLRPNRQHLYCEYFGENSNKAIRVLFDFQDNCAMGVENYEDIADVVFKRSYKIGGYPESKNTVILPICLYLPVSSSSLSYDLMRFAKEFFAVPYNIFHRKNRFHVERLIDNLLMHVRLKKSQAVSEKELINLSKIKGNGTILFQCRLWEPSAVSQFEWKQEDASSINSDRIEIIKRLKQEFGDKFIGGLQPSGYANKNYSDLITNMPSARRNYLGLVASASVVITTRGLMGSNGCKLGEYAYLGKAVVTETLHCGVPGELCAGKHYLDFANPEQCIENVHAIMSSHELQTKLENNLQAYRDKWLLTAAIADYIMDSLEKLDGH